MIGVLELARRRNTGVLFLLLALLMLLPATAHSQSQSSCTSGAVDYTNGQLGSEMTDVEQTVCLYYDGQTGLDADVDMENNSYEDFEPNVDGDTTDGFFVTRDLWVWGVGAEAQIWGVDSSYNYNLLADSGMNDGSPDSTGGSYAYASTAATTQQYATYVLTSLFDECREDPSDDNYGGNCSWNSQQGLSVQLQIAVPILTPTVSLSTSGTPSPGGQPVTFIAAVTGGGAAPTGMVTYYDGSTSIGGGMVTGGVAALTTAALSVGTHTITASFPGDTNYSPATSYGLSQEVVPVVGSIIPSNAIYGYVITPSGGTSGYEPNGNIASYTDSVNGAWSMVGGYDGLNRLTGAVAETGPFGGQSQCWTYDSFGNRTASIDVAGSACPASISPTVSYNGNNQVNWIQNVSATGLGYDAAGEVNADANNVYLYNGDGLMCAMENIHSGTAVGYIYDADGNRVAKGNINSWNGTCDMTSNGFVVADSYVMGLSNEHLTESDGQGNWVHTNVYAGAQMVATYDPKALHFQLTDWLGTRRVQTDSVGSIEETCQNLPSGDQMSCSTPGGAPPTADDATDTHFAGLDTDTESGLDHAIFRQYASNMGRWTSPDSYDGSMDIGNPQSLNRYSYVGNGPLNFRDPSGLKGENPIGTIAGMGGCIGVIASGGANPFADVGCAASLFSLLVPSPHAKFAGSTTPRPGAAPWDEYHIHYGPNIGAALGLPSGGCEYGVCGVIDNAVDQSTQSPSVVANCRWVGAYNIGLLFLGEHCDASVSIGDGWLYSISAGPINGRLRGFVTPRQEQSTGGTIFSRDSGSLNLGNCLIAKGRASQASMTDEKYNFLLGPNSNNWLNGIFASCGVNLGLHSVHLGFDW
jgi:RHS repeat-associated protein